MPSSSQPSSGPWTWCGALAALGLGVTVAALHAGDADAALQALPPELARTLALHPREARTQLPDGSWLVLERDGRALKRVQDRTDGRTLRRWPLPSPRRYASLSLLPSGRALLWGGVDADNRLQAGGLWFDPAAYTLTPAFEVPLSARAGHAASVLSDGRLLLTGGWTAAADAGARAEVWDERGGRAAPAAPAPMRLAHRARVEADGRVRLFEGVDAHGRALTQDQLYDPARGAASAVAGDAATGASAPRLSASSPRHGQSGVATDARLSLRFSEPLRAGELNAASVTLLGPDGYAAVQVTPAEAGRLLFVTPRQRLQANADYSLLVGGAHARSGRPLAPTLIDFATGAARADTAPAPPPAPATAGANNAQREPDSAQPKPTRVAAAVRASQPASSVATRAMTPAKPRNASARAALVAADVVVDGASLSVQTDSADEAVEFGFDIAQAGDYGLGLSGLTTPGSAAPATLTVQGSGGSVASLSCAAADDGCGANLPALAAGRYTARVQPPSGATLRFAATLSRDLSVNLFPGFGSALALDRRGRNASVNLTVAGPSHLLLSAQATQPAGREVRYTLYAADGSLVQSFVFAGAHATIDLATPERGSYRLRIDPDHGATYTATLAAGYGAANILVADGAVRDFVSEPGQPLRMQFALETGRPLGLGIGNLSIAGSAQPASLQVYKPNGSSAFPSKPCLPANGGCDQSLAVYASYLPPGIYTAVLTPPAGATARFSAALSSERTVDIAVGGSATLSLDRYGRNGRFVFDLAANEVLQLNVSPDTTPAQRPIGYSLVGPDGTTYFVKPPAVGAQTLVAAATKAGRYAWYVDPQQGELATVQATLTQASGSTAIGAEPVALSTQASGARASFSFANPRRSDLGIGIAELQLTGSASYADATVRNSRNAVVASEQCHADAARGGCDIDLRDLAADVYTVEIVPHDGQGTLSLRAAVSEDLVLPLSRSQPLELQIARIGQNATLEYDAAAGENLNVAVSGQITAPIGRFVRYALQVPAGYEIARNSIGPNGSGGISRENVAAGLHRVRIDPEYGATMSARVAMIDDFADELVVDGPPREIATQLLDQTVRLSFQVEPGARLGLGMDRLVGLQSFPLDLTLSAADGSVVRRELCREMDKSCAFNLDGLAGGRYTLKVDPPSEQGPYSFRATLSSDLELPLTLGQTLALQQDRWGRNVRLRFNAGPGDDLYLAVADVQRLAPPPPGPTRRDIEYTLRGPDGATIRSYSHSDGVSLRIADLTQSGEYTLSIDPPLGDALGAQIWLGRNQPLDGIEIDGDAVVFASPQPGAPMRLSFQAPAGAKLRFGIAPDGPAPEGGFAVDGGSCYISDSEQGCAHSVQTQQAGRYEISVSQKSVIRPMQFRVRATLSTTYQAALQLGTPQTLNLRSGQNALLSFQGAYRQRLRLTVSGQATLPAGYQAYYGVRRPGERLSDFDAFSTAPNGTWELPPLPATGEYFLETAAIGWPGLQTTVLLEPMPTP
jgi:hypothetical protein